MNMYEFSSQIKNLKKENRYNEAINFFKEHKHLFSEADIGKNKFVISDMITCLRKSDKAKYVYGFLKIYHVLINENSEEMILNSYGWAVYDNIKQKTINKHQIIEHTSYLIYLLFSKKSDYSYNVISNIFMVVLKISKENQNQDYAFIDNFCNLFDVGNLTLQSQTFELNGKSIEQASDKEKWYSEKSKALYHLAKYQECRETSEEALKAIDKFHNHSDLWFARRIALSLKELGNIDEAIEKLHDIYKKKKEWFIQKEIAELYFEKGDFEIAFNHCIEALNTKGKIEFKIGLINLMAKILKERDELQLAQKHFLLVKKIREAHGWKVSDDLLTELDITMKDDVSPKDLKKELLKFWNSKNNNRQKTYQGTIKKIIHDNDKGKVGFIKGQDKDYYFSLPRCLRIIDNIYENKSVLFKILQSEDKKESAKIIEVIN